VNIWRVHKFEQSRKECPSRCFNARHTTRDDLARQLNFPSDLVTMPGELLVPSPKTRPVTRRTSIRQSLNLASVSKAFADVINKDKDNKDTNKTSKKSKDSRRLSASLPELQHSVQRMAAWLLPRYLNIDLNLLPLSSPKHYHL
jgi:hypothetical protein